MDKIKASELVPGHVVCLSETAKYKVVSAEDDNKGTIHAVFCSLDGNEPRSVAFPSYRSFRVER